MKIIKIEFLENEYKIIPLKIIKDNNVILNDLYKLIVKNYDSLTSIYLDISFLKNNEQFMNLVKMSIDFSIVYKNDALIGMIYTKGWGKYPSLEFWLDEKERQTKIFSELLSLYLKQFSSLNKCDLIVFNLRNKLIENKKIIKKLGFKNSFRFNYKYPEFNDKKVIATPLFYKVFNHEFNFSLEIANMFPKELEIELETFLLDLVDYEFKRNNFILDTKYGKYYWSGIDVTDEMKEVYFINFTKSKSVYKKMLKKIHINEEYLNLYKMCKRFYIIFNKESNAASIFFIGEKNNQWIHFDNSLM